MGTSYGINSKIIYEDDIDNIVANGVVVTASGDHPTRGYSISWYSTLFGCGNAEMRFLMDLKETYPRWNYLTYKVDYLTTSTCWFFNERAVPNNIETFDTSLGDMMYLSKNCFELPQFNVVSQACDNSASNAFRVSVGEGSKSFYTKRRRNSSAGLAGPAMYFSCCPTGPANVCTVSDIRVY